MRMIRIERLENEVAQLKEQWGIAEPFSHVVIDDFLTDSAAAILNRAFPDPAQSKVNKSRDYVFAKNKFEKSGFPKC